MATRPLCYLLDGPLMLAPERAAAMVARMTPDIADVWCDKRDAERALRAKGYPMLDVMLLLDEVIHAAMMDEVVAGEMMEP